MVNLISGKSFIDKMAVISDLAAILDFSNGPNVLTLVSCVVHESIPIHLVHLVTKYLWKRLINLRFWLKMGTNLNNALNTTRKPFFFISKSVLDVVW